MKIGTKIMKGIVRAFSALPLKVHYAWAGFFSWILKDLMHYRKDVIMINLSRSFPDKKYGELKEISNRFYKYFGQLIAESIWFGGCRNPERLRKQHIVEFKNIEELEDAYRDGRGVVVLNSHFGNWELTGGFFSYDYREDAKLPFTSDEVVVVYKPLTSRMWDEIMRENRCAPILKEGFKGYISSRDILRFAISNRDKKLVYVFPTDQCPYKGSTSDDTVTFLHQPTKTMLGGASIAHKFGLSVFYMAYVPVSKGRYRWSLTKICQDGSTMTPHEIMQEFYNCLQSDIEKYPWCYLWTHKRWKR